MAPGLSISNSMFASQPWMIPTNTALFSPMASSTSIYSTRTSSNGASKTYSTANESAEQREKRIECELKNKNASAAKTSKSKQKDSEVLNKLTVEEQQCLSEYMEKIDKRENSKSICDTATISTLGFSLLGAKAYIDKVPEPETPVDQLKGVRKWFRNSKPRKWLKALSHSREAAVEKEIAKCATKGVTIGNTASNIVKYADAGAKVVSSKGTAAFAAVTTVMEDLDELAVAYSAGFGSGLKQTGQTVVKAGSVFGGFWAGAKAGGFAGAKLGALIGSVFPGAGNVIGAAVGGFIGSVAGGLLGQWGAKKAARAIVGKDVGDKIREQQALEVAEAGKNAKHDENSLSSIQTVLQFAQTDTTIDEKTVGVLNKLQQICVTA